MKTVKTTQGSKTDHLDRIRHDEAGFVMVEAALGAVVLGIMIVGMLQIFSFAELQVTNRFQEMSAYNMARSRLEEVIGEGSANAVAKIDSGLTVYGDVPAIRTTTVSFIDDPADGLGAADADGPQDIKQVDIVVTYANGKTVALKANLIP